eukprot:CAMPEP_0173274778 /NCGR_PEP_ID=MMETSP1143-20121109/2626_1 /TAXON_ID=483371 /ORGANISM="non described non described, Strain CCMP2298" /LENGTH=93 /DNA_ID=CAMNT_0014211621 /DNA_START=1619 /DNA_END=1901 /DNA_ORIENTATION=+
MCLQARGGGLPGRPAGPTRAPRLLAQLHRSPSKFEAPAVRELEAMQAEVGHLQAAQVHELQRVRYPAQQPVQLHSVRDAANTQGRILARFLQD